MAEGTLGQRLSSSFQGGKRFLIIVGGVAVVSLAAYFFASSDPVAPVSDIRVPPNGMRNVPGSNAPSSEMANMIDQQNRARQERAQQVGGSALPTVVAQPIVPVDLPTEDRNRQGDLNGLQRPDPPVARPMITPPVLPVAPVMATQAINQVDDNLAELMKRQMEQIAKLGFGPADVKYHYKDTGGANGVAGASQAQTAAGAAGDAIDPLSGLKLPLPGTILYAEMVSTANSDAPGPVLARVAQGEFAGATLIGTFEARRDSMVITFRTMTVQSLRDGTEVNKSVQINAVGVDTKNIGTAMATDVDRHLLANVGFTAAAAFAQGFGSAIGQSGSSIVQGTGGITITNPALTTRQQLYVAGGAAAGAAGGALNQAFGNRPPTITVASGTPLGILFLPTGSQ
ncbi:DotG/IcmE/VirB10 family protein [Bosea sp. RAC05]|uniref:DotG/IcmE/VirB10 family protein n=1 Tax=Bosea sp. RAC05 TaxID=1842539 RepID=UPI00083CC9C1|nr:DotG/IcmE/VirB10 family protein [Bosea sp. RAC05]AOG03189.1 bacterial conjugation TrbI-like family protein [Bosea sp. RAC05]